MSEQDNVVAERAQREDDGGREAGRSRARRSVAHWRAAAVQLRRGASVRAALLHDCHSPLSHHACAGHWCVAVHARSAIDRGSPFC